MVGNEIILSFNFILKQISNMGNKIWLEIKLFYPLTLSLNKSVIFDWTVMLAKHCDIENIKLCANK